MFSVLGRGGGGAGVDIFFVSLLCYGEDGGVCI